MIRPVLLRTKGAASIAPLDPCTAEGPPRYALIQMSDNWDIGGTCTMEGDPDLGKHGWMGLEFAMGIVPTSSRPRATSAMWEELMGDYANVLVHGHTRAGWRPINRPEVLALVTRDAIAWAIRAHDAPKGTAHSAILWSPESAPRQGLPADTLCWPWQRLRPAGSSHDTLAVLKRLRADLALYNQKHPNHTATDLHDPIAL